MLNPLAEETSCGQSKLQKSEMNGRSMGEFFSGSGDAGWIRCRVARAASEFHRDLMGLSRPANKDC
jgi:hypothetical protein